MQVLAPILKTALAISRAIGGAAGSGGTRSNPGDAQQGVLGERQVVGERRPQDVQGAGEAHGATRWVKIRWPPHSVSLAPQRNKDSRRVGQPVSKMTSASPLADRAMRKTRQKQVIRAVYIHKTREGRYYLYFDVEDEIEIMMAIIGSWYTDLPSMAEEYEDHADAVRAGLDWLTYLGCHDTIPHDNFE